MATVTLRRLQSRFRLGTAGEWWFWREGVLVACPSCERHLRADPHTIAQCAGHARVICPCGFDETATFDGWEGHE